MAKKLTRSAVLGAVVLMLAPGPGLAFCLDSMPVGGCCPPDSCKMPKSLDAPRCCAPVEAPPVAAANGQGLRSLPLFPAMAFHDAVLPVGSAQEERFRDRTDPEPFRGSLYTLHAVFLI